MAPRTLEGKTLGKYQILEPLGRGGMAQVYRAYHPQLDRYVAIKVLRSDLVGEEEFLARFSREARAVAALRHPNIVQVFDFDVQDDDYYMVMELMEGHTLKARLQGYRSRGAAMPVPEMTRILAEVLDGLGYAHAEGIIHRDIKPANILLTRRGQAVITDFGIAQIVGGTNYTVAGALMGTLHYMAPEQGMGQPVDGRSDLYALGVVLYEILTGRPPFDADTPLAILLKHLNDPLPLPREPGAQIPAPLERVVLKSLAKKPEDRYQTAAEMAQALKQAAADCPQTGPDAADHGPEASAPLPVLEPPQVYSGTARANLKDVNFAADVTDPNLEDRLKAAQTVPPVSEPPVSVSLVQEPFELEPPVSQPRVSEPPVSEPQDLSASFDEVFRSASRLFSTVGGALSGALTSAVEEGRPVPALREEGVAQVEAPDVMLDEANAEASDLTPWPRTTTHASLLGVYALVGWNLLALGLGITAGWWGLFSYGWPAEMLLVALLLFLLMGPLANIWLLVPAGILLGNGILFSFYAVTGNWWLWGLLWPLEPLLVFGCIFAAMTLDRRPDRLGERVARRFGRPLAVVSALLVAVITLGALVSGLIRGLFS